MARPYLTPYQQVRRQMEALGMASDLLVQLPRRWVKLGDVALIKLPEALRMWARQLGGAYAHALNVVTVGEVVGVHGELRRPRLRLYYGTRTRCEVCEHGLRYRLDVARVMWAPGNVGWRAGPGERGDNRVATLYRVEPGPKTIVDMFAGVGYFALPLARAYPRATVVAAEKHPVALAYLKENLALNQLVNVVPWSGDCRELPGPGHPAAGALAGGAQLIHMGYLGGTAAYLPRALELLDPAGGVVLYHDSYPNVKLLRLYRSQWADLEPPPVLESELRALAEGAGRTLQKVQAARVKSYAPGVTHLVARLELGASRNSKD